MTRAILVDEPRRRPTGLVAPPAVKPAEMLSGPLGAADGGAWTEIWLSAIAAFRFWRHSDSSFDRFAALALERLFITSPVD
jgi:hypothetical protein